MIFRNIVMAGLSIAVVTSTAAASEQKKDKKDKAVVSAGRQPMNPSIEDVRAAEAAAAEARAAAELAAAPKVGGVAMLPTRTIAENAALAPNLSTLVQTSKAAGVDATLAGPGPYTVFAPTNEAFGRLAPGTIDTLLKPENKGLLTRLLSYHTIAGAVSGFDLQEKIKAGGGTYRLTTLEGETLVATLLNGGIVLTDVNGNKSYIETFDIKHSNGVVHVVNGVLIPKLG